MVTLQTADNALKEVYLGVVSDQLNTSINPLLAKMPKISSKQKTGKQNPKNGRKTRFLPDRPKK